MSNARSPTAYAAEKLPMLLARWRSDPGRLVQWFAPLQWRGVPGAAVMGLTASSMGQREVVGDLTTDASAVGLFGVEGPAIRAYTTNATVRSLLGHASHAMPAYLDNLDDQVVTGIANYRRHLAAVTAALPASLRPSSVSSLYAYRLAAGAYSLGEGTVAAVLSAYEDELSALDEGARWDRLRGLLERDAARRDTIGGVRARGEWGAAHLAVRVDQRVESGRALARALRQSTSWWGSTASSGPALVALAYGSSAQSTSTGGNGVVVLAVALAALVWLRRK